MTDPVEVVRRFNDRITVADLDGLAALMSDDHVFVDTAGGRTEGKPACVEAWRGFFAAFPGYLNTFETVVADGADVTAVGRSDCPGTAELTGPARWTATVAAGLVSRWQVEEV